MLADKIEWIVFVILSVVAFIFMFGGSGDDAIEKFRKEQTTFMVSSKPIEELPTFLFCFHLKVEGDYDILGKDFMIKYASSGVTGSTK